MDKLSIYVNSKSTWVRRQAAIGEKRASKAFFIVTACRTDDDAVIRISIFEEKVMALGMVLDPTRSEEHTSELQSLMRISYAVFCLKKKNNKVHRKWQTKAKKRQTMMYQEYVGQHKHDKVANLTY